MLADPEAGELDDLVDVERYPIDDSEAGRALATRVHGQLRAEGAVTLPGFLRPAATAAIADELAAAAVHVPIRRHCGTVYARDDLEALLPADDPRRVAQEWVAGHVTRDMIPPHSAAHRLYVSPAFKSFIAGCVDAARIFEYADPLAGLVATMLPPGGRYPWHYDTNEFVVTIMIQRPTDGGRFEYWPNLRAPGDENLDGLAAVLDGSDRTGVRATDNGPGDLQLFLGRYSLHRVTDVSGPAARHVLVLSYAEQPGLIGPLDRTRRVYGRVTEAHLIAAEMRERGCDGLIL